MSLHPKGAKAMYHHSGVERGGGLGLKLRVGLEVEGFERKYKEVVG